MGRVMALPPPPERCAACPKAHLSGSGKYARWCAKLEMPLTEAVEACPPPVPPNFAEDAVRAALRAAPSGLTTAGVVASTNLWRNLTSRARLGCTYSLLRDMQARGEVRRASDMGPALWRVGKNG